MAITLPGDGVQIMSGRTHDVPLGEQRGKRRISRRFSRGKAILVDDCDVRRIAHIASE
ncbi:MULTISPECIES: hypothetical protein [unclassified Paraburkholderia]|uniref:hypothetical protein n=1 Tax=unclassified Paraburkholderia TaxID=2615204 RepID=UPI00161F30D0|nr:MULTISPECIES: hypothetical protein [unclassified Paraburkholderia]MBB5407475.1 hypothetical protein [Paraburkholderia sp. HC6.4b]MBB5453768.1 hypothetical protein [Paraburkholderia sp. Kb1A]